MPILPSPHPSTGNFSLTASQLPVPTPPPGVLTRSPGCTSQFSSAPVDLPYSSGTFASDIALYLNQLLAEVANLGIFSGGVPGLLGAYTVQGPLSLYAAYNATTNYMVGQICSYSGQNYVCILNSINHLPTNATYFSTTTLG